jgi:hypothetical protein
VSDDLVGFLRARITEDEQLALSTLDLISGPSMLITSTGTYNSPGFRLSGVWVADGGVVFAVKDLMSSTRCDQHPVGIPNDCDDTRVLAVDDPPKLNDDKIAEHAAAWDPVRVLTECVSKRLIIRLCEDAITAGELEPDTTWNDDAAGAEVGGEVLRLLALPDAGHPDYRQEWVPRSPVDAAVEDDG